MRRLPAYLLIMILVVSAMPRCAQIVAPTGGPRDSLPPVLLSADPPDSTLHFDARSITLEFSEYVQVQDLQKQMIIAPNPERQPGVTAKLRSVTIKWNDTLKPSTTYTINLGNAVQDINEGNPFRNFRYVFSTGDYLDSLQIAGKLFQASTGIPDSNVTVMLYDQMEDSVVSKSAPLYYTRSLADGSFAFQNLPHDTFKLFVLKDVNGDLRYDDSTEAIAFPGAQLVLDSNRSDLALYLFREEVPPDTLAPAKATATDSAAAKARKLAFSLDLNEGKQDLDKPLHLHFSAPLRRADSSLLRLEEDTTLRPVAFSYALDTGGQDVRLEYAWKENTPYRLIVDSSFALDTGGLHLPKPDTTSFTTKSLSDYGTLALHFVDVDSSQHYVVQLVQRDQVLFSSPLENNVWKKAFLNPGDYGIRILKDDNGNGHWDTGCYYCAEKRQPEKVITLPQTFSVKANWDNEKTDLRFSFGP